MKNSFSPYCNTLKKFIGFFRILLLGLVFVLGLSGKSYGQCPIEITLSASTTPVNCSGGFDGTITFTASGGTGTLSYSTVPASSSGPVVPGNNFISNLSAGVYTLIITDENGCSASIIILVGETTPINISCFVNYSICHDINGGSIGVAVTGGTPLYTYSWTGPNGFTSTTQYLTGLAVGNYCLTVTDANGCTATHCCEIPSTTPPMEIMVSYTNPLCHDDANGSITVTVNGGMPEYILTGIGAPVTIPSGSNSHIYTGLAAGFYAIEATCQLGCVISSNVLLMNPLDITLSATATQVNCSGGNDGTITFTASGGTGILSYSTVPASSSGPVVPGNNFISNLSAENYTLIITDTNGCQKSITIVVDETTPSSTNTTTQTACDSYTWNGQTYTTSGTFTGTTANCVTESLDLTINPSTSSSSAVTALDSYTWPVNNQTYTVGGIYTGIIPNAEGCDSIITLNLTMNFTDINEISYSSVYVSPNPIKDNFTIVGLELLGTISALELKDANGKIVKILDSKTTEFNIKDFEAGVYFLAIYSVKTKDVIKLVKE